MAAARRQARDEGSDGLRQGMAIDGIIRGENLRDAFGTRSGLGGRSYAGSSDEHVNVTANRARRCNCGEGRWLDLGLAWLS